MRHVPALPRPLGILDRYISIPNPPYICRAASTPSCPPQTLTPLVPLRAAVPSHVERRVLPLPGATWLLLL
jgi:hypothetical protein